VRLSAPGRDMLSAPHGYALSEMTANTRLVARHPWFYRRTEFTGCD
jgi:hypothetical protein